MPKGRRKSLEKQNNNNRRHQRIQVKKEKIKRKLRKRVKYNKSQAMIKS